MKTLICLIRHGQTDWNKEMLIQGTINNPLNDTGRSQAKVAANLLKEFNIDFDVLISSPLDRAYETMEIIKSNLKLTKSIETMKNVQEREFGDLEGKKVCEESYRLMESNQVNGLETLSDLQKRAINALIEIGKKYPNKKVLVTTHSQIIKGALSYLIKDFDFKCVITNSSLNFFEVNNNCIKPLYYNINEYKKSLFQNLK